MWWSVAASPRPRRPSRRPRAPTSGISRSPAMAPRMFARPPASRNGNSPPPPTAPPTISLAKDPERQARGSLQMSYKIEDDYGVTEARAQFVARPAIRGNRRRREGCDQAAEPRPLFDAPQFALVLPNARTRNGVGQTVKDLSEDPYAGADVTLTLTAKDEAGNEGKSEPFNMRLPERLFTKPLARALIEQRRILALDANQNAPGLCRARRADDRAGTVHARSRPLSRPLQRGAAAGGRPHRRRHARGRRQPVGARRHHRGRQYHRRRQGAARGAGSAQAGAGARRQRRGDQEADRESARGAGQFHAPARRAAAQQSAAIGAPARSQHQDAAPAGPQEHDRPHGAAVALRRQGSRASNCSSSCSRCWKTCRWRSPASPATARWSRR